MTAVPDSALNMIFFECIFGILFPVAALLYWKKKHDVQLFPAFIGALTYIVFEQVFSSFLNQFIIQSSSDIAASLYPGTVLYAVYGGMFSAVFGELGRFLSFKYVVNEKYRGIRSAVTYGIGHGGAECVIVLGLSAAFYSLFAISVNSGVSPAELSSVLGGEISVVENIVVELSATTATTFLFAVFERLSMFAANLSLSLLMYKCIESKKVLFLLASLLLHGAVYAAIMYIPNVSGSLALEVVLVAMLSGIFIYLISVLIQSEHH